MVMLESRVIDYEIFLNSVLVYSFRVINYLVVGTVFVLLIFPTMPNWSNYGAFKLL